jgi:hypothetical protein
VPSDPGGDPIGFLEAMRTQIGSMIAQGPAILDPNTGRDLQNSIADLENAVTAARQNGGKGNQQRSVQNKITNLTGKISDGAGNGLISQSAAATLSSELQNLSDALGNQN